MYWSAALFGLLPSGLSQRLGSKFWDEIALSPCAIGLVRTVLCSSGRTPASRVIRIGEGDTLVTACGGW